eukprot:1050130-Prorocentrum_minimum.AAC.1
MERLGARRVAHGVRAAEDPELMAAMARLEVCCDVCPTSNVLLNVAPSLQAHPLRVLMQAGPRPFRPPSDPPSDPLGAPAGAPAEGARPSRSAPHLTPLPTPLGPPF